VDSIHLPNAITLPTAFGGPGAPVPPGQLVQALVLALIESDVFRLQLPQATVDVRTDVPLMPGSTIALAVKGGGPSARLVIYSDVPSPPVGQGAFGLAGRQPIGEAVVIARAPIPAAQPRVQNGFVADPTTNRRAPSISPARELPPQAEISAVRPLTPAQAVSDAVRAAAPRQSGLAPLFADLEHVLQSAAQTPSPPARAAAADVLALRIPLDEKLGAAIIKHAFVGSGVLLEPRLAAVQTMPGQDAGIPAPSPSNDVKAALLVLREVLKVWSAGEPAANRNVAPATLPITAPLESAAARVPTNNTIEHLASALAGASDELISNAQPLSPEQATNLARTVASALTGRDAPSGQAAASQSGGLPPPYRGAPMTPQAPAAPSLTPDAAPHDIAERLITQTDGALARQTLLQVASLPAQPDLPRAEANQRWSFEIPFATSQGTAIAQFEVSRDGQTAKSDPQARTWRARFSLDVEPMGSVHASIALNGARTSVTLWAERTTTATQLQDNAPLLSDALRAAELEPADLQLRVGAPPPMARQAALGRFMDRAT